MENKPKIILLNHTPDPDKLVASAAKLCYSASDISAIMDNLTEDIVEDFVKRLSDIGHASPFEHASFTFGIEGVSRITEQQLTRHRVASYSIQSGRYVTRNDAEFIEPPYITNNAKASNIYKEFVDSSKGIYTELSELLKAEHYETLLTKEFNHPSDPPKTEQYLRAQANKMGIEDARYVFPGSLSTKIIFTMNARELFGFFSHRSCNRAQWEIKEVSDIVLRLCKQVAPHIFKNAGASCVHGICPEGGLQCDQLKGVIPTMDEVKILIHKYYNKE